MIFLLAIITSDSLFHFSGMIFGLKSGSASCQYSVILLPRSFATSLEITCAKRNWQASRNIKLTTMDFIAGYYFLVMDNWFLLNSFSLARKFFQFGKSALFTCPLLIDN